MHARYFSANLGRFQSVDPIGAAPSWPQSWNRYSYVLGNPMKYVDPEGLQPVQDYGAAGGIFADPYGEGWLSYDQGFFNFLTFGSFLRNLSFFSSGFGARAPTAPTQLGPGPGYDPCEDSSNIVLDTLEGVIEDIGALTVTASVPLWPIPGGAGAGFSASVTGRPDGSADLYVGFGGIVGSSARASAPGLGGTLWSRSTGVRPSGLGVRAAGALGILNPLSLPVGVRGSGFMSQGGDGASAGLGVVGGGSGSLTFGRFFSLADPYEGPCR